MKRFLITSVKEIIPSCSIARENVGGWFTFDQPWCFQSNPDFQTHPEIQTVVEPVAQPGILCCCIIGFFTNNMLKSTANHGYNNTHRVAGGCSCRFPINRCHCWQYSTPRGVATLAPLNWEAGHFRAKAVNQEQGLVTIRAL